MLAVSSPSHRASVWEWTQTALLAANLGWTTLCLGGYRAETMAVTVTLNALLLAVHVATRSFGGDARSLHPAGWCLVPFVVYAWANVTRVTPVCWLGWHDWLIWAQLVAVFWVVVNDLRARATRRVLFGALVAVATLSAVLACYQRFAEPSWLMLGATQSEQFLARSSGAFVVPNSFAGLLVLVLPAMLLPLWARRVSAVARVGLGYVAALLLLALGLTLSRGAWLALAVAVAGWPLLVPGLRRLRRATIFCGVVLGLTAAVLTVYQVVPRARERLDFLMRDAGERSRPVMWRAAGKIFSAQPVFGSGAASYAVFFEPHRPEHEQKDPVWTHNDYLNTLSDYGAVGFTLFFGAGGLIAWRCWRRKFPADAAGSEWDESSALTTALAVGLLAFALHLAVDFHLKMPALAMAAATVAGLWVARAWPGRTDHDLPREPAVRPALGRLSTIAGGIGAGATMVGTIFWAVPHYRAEGLRDAARRSLDLLAKRSASPAERRAIVVAAGADFSRAIGLDPTHAQAWADRAYVAAILGHDERSREKQLGVEAEADARRALALSAVVPEFWLRLGVALDMQGRWLEAGEAFAEALRRAPVNATTWFYHAYHLSLNPVTLPLARSAVATSLRLDPSRPESESLRQDLAARR